LINLDYFKVEPDAPLTFLLRKNNWGNEYLRLPDTSACFSPKMAINSTISEQTTWYVYLSMGKEVPAVKRYLFVHLLGNVATGEVSTGEVPAARRLGFLQPSQPLPRILHLSYPRISIFPQEKRFLVKFWNLVRIIWLGVKIFYI